jgi:hypothetical protein
MKYSLFVVALIALTLTACGDPKPGQYPPSFMDRDMLSDADLEAVQKESAKQEVAKAAKKSAPAVDSEESQEDSDEEAATEDKEKTDN